MSAVIAELPSILVVDDHKHNLIAMKHLLKDVNGQVVCAQSGNEALKQVLKNDFAVVLMDVQMPEMNGFETAEIIRSYELTQDLPIIFVTAINKEEKYVQKGYQLGAVDYLFKPFDPSILQYKVKVFIELFSQRQRFIKLAKKNKLILDSVQEGVIGLNMEGELVFSNPAAQKLLGLKKDDIVPYPFQAFISHSEPWVESLIYKQCLSLDTYFGNKLVFKSMSGETFSAECTVSPMLNQSGVVEGFVAVFNDITQRIKAEQQLIHMAEYDPLTGLANRRMFYRLLPKLLAKASRLKHKVVLFFIDIDHFKSINDALGHSVGDLLLCHFSRRLKSCVRESDTVVRLSGDEFTIILEGHYNEQSIEEKAKGIVDAMSHPFKIENHEVNCSVSIGISFFPDITTLSTELIKTADIAMYNAKEKGRNCFQFYDEKLNQETSFRTKIETSLKSAIDQNEFSLVFQPKVDIKTMKLTGFEALARWSSHSLGAISPSMFVPIAEDCGRINELGIWVFKDAIEKLRNWKKQGCLDDEFRLSINFSVKQLIKPGILDEVKRILSKADVDCRLIDIEITETALMSNGDIVIPLLKEMSRLGLTISVDDFGTGYSSLNYLKLLPLHNLKIDQSFICDLFVDANSEIITRSIINLAHNLGLKVVAEGIENRAQLKFLMDNHCDYGQGFLIEKPLSVEDANKSLANGFKHLNV